MKSKVIVVGNPVEGCQYYGPYNDLDEMMKDASYLDAEYWVADLDTIKSDKIVTSIVLVAFEVAIKLDGQDNASNEEISEIAQYVLMPKLMDMSTPGKTSITSWWFAEDHRVDHSDNQSAVFIPSHMSQLDAVRKLNDND